MQPYEPSLEKYLEWVLAGPWRWGKRDCCQFAARWVEARTGREVLDVEGRTYVSAREALALVRTRGGMAAMVGGYWARADLARTANPEHGDVGLVRLPRGPMSLTGEACVVRYATRWLGLTPTGLCSVEISPYACWRVE